MTPLATFTEDLFTQDPARWHPRLIRVLEEQRELAARLDRLSTQQSDLAAAGDAQAVLDMLAERRPLIERLSAINTTLAPFRAAADRALARLDTPQRENLSAIAAEITRLIDQVRLRDEADRTAVRRHRDRIADDLARLTRHRGAVAAYAASEPAL
jgi:hypothetical protein